MRRVSAATRTRQAVASTAVMERIYGAGWVSNPRARKIHGELTSSLDAHASKLVGGSLSTWKQAALKAVRRAKDADVIDLPAGNAPGIAVGLPYTPGTKQRKVAAASMHKSYAAYLAATKLGSTGESSRNILGNASDRPHYGPINAMPEELLPDRPQKDVNDVEREVVIRPTAAIAFNFGGSDGPRESLTGPMPVDAVNPHGAMKLFK
jgi:hypothetical protein